jgi:hypothetical protein
MEQLVRIPCSNSLTSVTPFSIADILMTRGQEALERAQAQDQALDMTRKPAGKLHGKSMVFMLCTMLFGGVTQD